MQGSHNQLRIKLDKKENTNVTLLSKCAVQLNYKHTLCCEEVRFKAVANIIGTPSGTDCRGLGCKVAIHNYNVVTG